jgi:hypothetical protein
MGTVVAAWLGGIEEPQRRGILSSYKSNGKLGTVTCTLLPATQEAEAVGPLKPRSSRPAWAT